MTSHTDKSGTSTNTSGKKMVLIRTEKTTKAELKKSITEALEKLGLKVGDSPR